MKCPVCGDKLIFIQEGMYKSNRYYKRTLYGRYYECESCCSEVLCMSGGKLKVIHEGVIDCLNFMGEVESV